MTSDLLKRKRIDGLTGTVFDNVSDFFGLCAKLHENKDQIEKESKSEIEGRNNKSDKLFSILRDYVPIQKYKSTSPVMLLLWCIDTEQKSILGAPEDVKLKMLKQINEVAHASSKGNAYSCATFVAKLKKKFKDIGFSTEMMNKNFMLQQEVYQAKQKKGSDRCNERNENLNLVELSQCMSLLRYLHRDSGAFTRDPYLFVALLTLAHGSRLNEYLRTCTYSLLTDEDCKLPAAQVFFDWGFKREELIKQDGLTKVRDTKMRIFPLLGIGAKEFIVNLKLAREFVASELHRISADSLVNRLTENLRSFLKRNQLFETCHEVITVRSLRSLYGEMMATLKRPPKTLINNFKKALFGHHKVTTSLHYSQFQVEVDPLSLDDWRKLEHDMIEGKYVCPDSQFTDNPRHRPTEEIEAKVVVALEVPKEDFDDSDECSEASDIYEEESTESKVPPVKANNGKRVKVMDPVNIPRDKIKIKLPIPNTSTYLEIEKHQRSANSLTTFMACDATAQQLKKNGIKPTHMNLRACGFSATTIASWRKKKLEAIVKKD